MTNRIIYSIPLYFNLKSDYMELLRKKMIAGNHKKKYERPSLIVHEMTIENVIASSKGFGSSSYIETDDSIFEYESFHKSNKYKGYEYGNY